MGEDDLYIYIFVDQLGNVQHHGEKKEPHELTIARGLNNTSKAHR
jgi:hypothetical protein